LRVSYELRDKKFTLRGSVYEVLKYFNQGKSTNNIEFILDHLQRGDEDQYIRSVWNVPIWATRVKPECRVKSRYAQYWYGKEKTLFYRFGQQVNGLMAVYVHYMVKETMSDGKNSFCPAFKRVGYELVETMLKVPYVQAVELTYGELTTVCERGNNILREKLLRGNCDRCFQHVYVKEVTHWGVSKRLSSGCVCGGTHIENNTKAKEEQIYIIERNKSFARLRNKRNRDPNPHLPIPWVNFQEVTVPVKTGNILYLDTEGSPPCMWQIFDPKANIVYVTIHEDTATTMLENKVVYSWGSEGKSTIDLQICDTDGGKISLKNAMEKIGYTLDKRYTLSDWGCGIRSNRALGEEKYRREAFLYAARDAIAVYLWHVCSRYVDPVTIDYILVTDIE